MLLQFMMILAVVNLLTACGRPLDAVTTEPDPCEMLSFESEKRLFLSEPSLEFVRNWIVETYHLHSSAIAYRTITDSSMETLHWQHNENSYLARFQAGQLKHIIIGFPDATRPLADAVITCVGSPETYTATDYHQGAILIEVTLWYPSEGMAIRAFRSREEVQLPLLTGALFMDNVTLMREGTVATVVEDAARYPATDNPAIVLPLMKPWNDDWTFLQKENEPLLKALTE